jgi:hypothetical protein
MIFGKSDIIFMFSGAAEYAFYLVFIFLGFEAVIAGESSRAW